MSIVNPALSVPHVIHLIALRNNESNDCVIFKANPFFAEVMLYYVERGAKQNNIDVNKLYKEVLLQNEYEKMDNLHSHIVDDCVLPYTDLVTRIINAPVLIGRNNTTVDAYIELMRKCPDFRKQNGVITFDDMIGPTNHNTNLNNAVQSWFNF